MEHTHTPGALTAQEALLLPHTQNKLTSGQQHLFVIIADSEGEVRVENTLLPFEAGCLLHIAPRVQAIFSCSHSRPGTALLTRVSAHAASTLLQDVQERNLVQPLLHEESPIETLVFPAQALPPLLRCHALLREEQASQRPFSLRIDGRLSGAFLLMLARECSLQQKNLSASAALGAAERAVQIIQLRYAESLTLCELARELGLSGPYFSVLFQRSTGCSFSQFLLQTRIARAKEMLLDSEELITQIAEASGFGSSAHFGALFRKMTGFSPLQYRKAHRTPAQSSFSAT